MMADAENLEFSNPKPFIKVKSDDGTEHTYYSIFSENLPEEWLQKAKEEVKETEEKKREGMRKLREYIRKENMPDIGDEYVLAVLRCCKYDMKKSKAKLTKFVKIYHMTVIKLSHFGSDAVDVLLDELPIGVFPYRDREGRIILFVRPALQIFSYDKEFVASGFIAAVIFVSTLPMASLLGLHFVFTCEVPEMQYFYPLMKICMHAIPQVVSLPHRIACVKCIHVNVLGRLVYRILRPFVSDKLNKRISFLGAGFEQLHKDYPPEIMPEEYGGYLGPMSAELFKQRMLVILKRETEIVSNM